MEYSRPRGAAKATPEEGGEMSNYQLAWDVDSKIIVCRLVGFLPDSEADALATDLVGMIQEARRRTGAFRLLFDNREGSVFSPKAAAALEIMKPALKAGDRTAVIVAGNLHKLQAMRSKSDSTQLFLSEADARAWLESDVSP